MERPAARRGSRGEAIGNDLRRKKNSCSGVRHGEGAAGEGADTVHLAKEEVGRQDVASMMDVLEQLGVSNYVQMLAQKQADLAQEALESVPTTERAREEMQELVEFLLTRRR